MKHIYYLIGILYVVYELGWLTSPIEKTKKYLSLVALMKEHKGKEWDDYSSEFKGRIKAKWYMILLVTWPLVGLFTYNWVVFAALIIIAKFLDLGRKISDNLYYSAVVLWVGSLVGFSLSLFAILNSYHLHIDLSNYVMGVFK